MLVERGSAAPAATGERPHAPVGGFEPVAGGAVVDVGGVDEGAHTPTCADQQHAEVVVEARVADLGDLTGRDPRRAGR